MSLDPKPEDGIHGLSMREMSPTRRFVIAVAGPLGSFVSAFFLLVVVFSLTGVRMPTTTIASDAAGLLAGDRVVDIDGRVATAAPLVSGNGELNVIVERNGRLVDVTVAAVDRDDVTVTSEQVRTSIGEGVPLAARATVRLVTTTVGMVGAIPSSIWDAVNPHTPGETQERPVSMIGVMQGSEQVADTFGYGGLVLLIAQISVTLGIFNLLPLPPLDGGHAVIAIVEGVGSKLRRREFRIPETAVNRVALGAFALLLTFSAVIMVLDVLFPVW